MTATAPVDFDRARKQAELASGFLAGAVTAAMIALGDSLGLYRTMRGAGSVDAADLAARSGLDERWLAEWLRSQAAAGILIHHGGERFELDDGTALVLADERNPFSIIGAFANLPNRYERLGSIATAFHTGRGPSFDDGGPEGAKGIERMLAPSHRTMLVPRFLPALEGVIERLSSGAKVADVGCGSGVALIELAKAFPASEFHGYDISHHALARASANAREAGVEGLVAFHDAAVDPLPADSSFDLVMTFDCLHDMTHPGAVASAIRAAVKPGGAWFIADINGAPTHEENLANPRSATMYGMSVLGCLASGSSEVGGAALGTLGLPEPAMAGLAAAAGFRRFRRLPIDHPLNAYYEARP